MYNSFIKVCAATPELRVCDVAYNLTEIENSINAAADMGAKIIVLPELCISGYSCRDMFLQKSLLDSCKKGLKTLIEHTAMRDAIIFVGMPFMYNSKLYNVVAAICHGKLLGMVPKKNLPNYGEFYEARQFTPGFDTPVEVKLEDGLSTYLGANQFFTCEELPELVIAAEICEDLWVPNPPSVAHCMNGATLIINPSASDELVGKAAYRKSLVANQSARLYCGYIYCSAGPAESTTDVVYSGHRLIAENGTVLSESQLFEEGLTLSEIDVEAIASKRASMNTYKQMNAGEYRNNTFHLLMKETAITRKINPRPFVPSDLAVREETCKNILDIQSHGLAKRIKHTHSKAAVIGISGGLDSTLALIVTVRAYELLGMDKSSIYGVTMPGFGTTDRTYNNACEMVKAYGATLKEISIKESVLMHFSDIGQDENVHDVTYENSQARMRTMLLMDLANKEGGMVVGTGDLSELALGWATYNGDHMSMYAVNSSVPKTLVRYLVACEADMRQGKLSEVLRDVLDTPVSPELLPPKEGVISQITEDLVGPYELHDFFLYYVMRYGFSPKKIFAMACIAFEDTFDKAFILKWEKTFYRRFFAQQFKRSCLPDGPKVGTVSLSPRGDLRMPSDASSALWLAELEEIEI